MTSRTIQPKGIRISAAGTPMIIQSRKVICMPVIVRMKLMATGLGPQPAGVAMPPKMGPQHEAIIRQRPKLLCSGLHPACFRIPTPMGSRMAATPTSETHMEIRVPMIRKPRMTRRVLTPRILSMASVRRSPRVVQEKAPDRRKTPRKKRIRSLPKLMRTISL